ncbi:hypothetical protein FRC02_000239 [Tulasnella sp. 418]|nr:hypothetical protein FRC02_000239 [Tulasnella sp. 418]
MVGSAKTAKNINKWNANKETASTSATAGETNHDLKPGDKGFEYSDPVALTCLLCLRQLKTLHQLQRHNTESEMHKANLKNHKQCKAGKEKVAAARKALETKPEGSDGGKGDEQQAPKYRDRAEERRRIHNQPDVPPPAASSSSGTNRAGSKSAITIAPRSAPLKPAKDENYAGNKLLKKMGWNEGGGLGVEGEGRVEPIKTTVYTAGVGLGAAKPKEVTSSTFSAGSGTGGSNSYAEAAKESARERLKS